MPKLLYVCCLMLVLSGCTRASSTSKTFFDSLINVQITNLAGAKASLTKRASIGGKEDELTFTPTKNEWETELDIFRQLDAFAKPAYQSSYQITDGEKDPASNLLVRRYHSSQNVPVPDLKFFYYRKENNLKKIEADLQESNSLFKGKRKIVLEFDAANGATHLSRYHIDGIQKMFLTDSVQFSITGNIRL